MLEKTISLIQEDIISDTLSEFVRIPSRNPPGEEKKSAEYAIKKMREWGLDAELVPHPDPNRPQAVASLRTGEKGKVLVLNGHLDVVPEGPRSSWSMDPFGGLVKDGRVYGRGACDMKGGLVAGMVAMKAIYESDAKLNGDVILHFAYGEETSEPGTKTLLTEQGFGGDWGIVLEPTNLKVAIAEQGRAEYRIFSEGIPCHASIPEQGINAIEMSAEVVRLLQDHHKTISTRTHPFMHSPTCTVTMISGGIKSNVVPASCWLDVDRRFLPSENGEGVGKELDKALKNINHRTQQLRLVDSAEIPFSSEIAQVVWRNVEKTTGISPNPWGTPYTSDVSNFVNDAKIPAVTFGPGDISQAHTFNESIPLDDIVKAAKVLLHTIHELLG